MYGDWRLAVRDWEVHFLSIDNQYVIYEIKDWIFKTDASKNC